MRSQQSAVSSERSTESGRKSRPRCTAYCLLLTAYPLFAAALLAAALSGCGSAPRREPAAKAPPSTPAPRGGGYYLDDGPGANPPADIDSIPDAVPRLEPVRSATSRPYVVMGRTYTPLTTLQPYKGQIGRASCRERV